MLNRNGLFGKYVEQQQKNVANNLYSILQQEHAKQALLSAASLTNAALIEYESTEEEEHLRVEEELENQQEEERLKNYDRHLALIEKGLNTNSLDWFSRKIKSLPPLTLPLPRFSDSEKIGIPLSENEEREGQCLFHTILLNEYLAQHQKVFLIQEALNHSYGSYYTFLLSPGLFDILANDPAYHPLVRMLYLYLLQDKNTNFLLNETNEQSVWTMFLRAWEPFVVLRALIKMEKPNPDMMMRYIAFWMDSIIDKKLITNIYADIKFWMSHDNYMPAYTIDIQRLCKQRILAIELEEQGNQFHASSSSDPVVNEFLNAHRYSIFWGGFGSTKSTKIHNMICSGDYEKAKELYLVDRKQLAAEINTKLHKESGEHSEFRLR